MNVEQTRKLFSYAGIDMPKITMTDGQNVNQAMLTISPLPRGLGTTIGNSLRRVLLGCMPGSAAVSVTASGSGSLILHEFSTIPGMTEDITELVLNLKGIVAVLNTNEKTVYLDAEGPMNVTADMLQTDDDLQIINPTIHLATLSEGAKLHLELRFAHGVGYASSVQNKETYGTGRIGELFIDSIFAPILNVSYFVDTMRVEENMNYEKLEISVTTNGSLSPQDAFSTAAQILKDQFGLIPQTLSGIEEEGPTIKKIGEYTKNNDNVDLERRIETLELSVRSLGGLKRSGINTIGDIVAKTLMELKSIRNLGAKSIGEIEEKIKELGLQFQPESNRL